MGILTACSWSTARTGSAGRSSFHGPCTSRFVAGTSFSKTGVYLLLGPRPEGDGEMLYLGEGDPVRPVCLSEIDSADLCRSYLWRYCVPLGGAVRT
jgi:hypothetical protein